MSSRAPRSTRRGHRLAAQNHTREQGDSDPQHQCPLGSCVMHVILQVPFSYASEALAVDPLSVNESGMMVTVS